MCQDDRAPGCSAQERDLGNRRRQGRLRIAGYADVVEEISNPQSPREALNLRPVEYKRGKMGRWLNDHVQLCAQAMCLEERMGQAIQQGYIFYFGSRRREPVEFTPELRARTEAAVMRAFASAASGAMPAPTDKRSKCHDCSLEPVCLPQEMDVLKGTGPVRSRRPGRSGSVEADE
jgi:CRISPR-associated exonuclease Cas4